MNNPDQEIERDVGYDLYLKIPQGWQVQTDTSGTVIRDPQTNLKLRIFCKPSPKSAIDLERFAELGLNHLLKTKPDYKPAGVFQTAEGFGWQGLTQMLYREGENKEASRLLYTALILPDKNDRQQQKNISILLEAPLEVFEKRSSYFRFLVTSKLVVGKIAAPSTGENNTEASKPAPSELSLHPIEKVATFAATAIANPNPAETTSPRSDKDKTLAPSSNSDFDEYDKYERLLLAAQGQKLIIYSIIINFVFRAFERNFSLPNPVFLTLAIIIAGFTLIGVVKICSGLGKRQNSKLAFMVASMFPLINLIVLVFLSIQATKVLRKAGCAVGLLGAKS